MINWYQIPPKSARYFILIIAMFNHSLKLSADKMVELSLITFGNVRNILILSLLYGFAFSILPLILQ